MAAAGMSVSVLCPEGRRVNVRVTPNTSVLQIIEEASLKQGLCPDNYDLKHLQRILDSSSSVRYAGLPNRCQLEMVETAVPRRPAPVIVHVATESGLRLVHDFPCTATLRDILMYHVEHTVGGENLLTPEGSQKEAVVVYAMRRMSGDELSTVTLRTLGFMNGKCMLRHSVQSVSSAGCQAHVSSSLASRPSQLQQHVKEKEVDAQSHQQQVVGTSSSIRPEPPSPSVPAAAPHRRHEQPQDSDMIVEEVTTVPLVSSSSPVVSPCKPTTSATTTTPAQSLTPNGANAASLNSSVSPQTLETPEPRIIKLGEHNAMVFSMADAPPTLTVDEDDSFFQLTAEEVRRLHKEQQEILKELVETPLMTKNMREMEESAKVLTALNRYPVTHLRIYFPDQHVIQASFKPLDTMADVITFVRPFLADPNIDFTLSTRHPVRTFPPSTTLVAADCVPNARLYFQSSNEDLPYLSQETLANKSSYSGACSSLPIQSSKSQPLGVSGKGNILMEASVNTKRKDGKDLNTQDSKQYVSSRETGAVSKLPKWFKVGK